MHAAYIGYGGMGLQIANLVRQIYAPVTETIFDDNLVAQGAPGARPFAEHTSDEHADKAFFVCLGYKVPAVKRRIIHDLLARGRSLPTVIHPTAYVDARATLSPGVIMFPKAQVDMCVSIGLGTVLQHGSIIAHDATVGECCFVSPSCVLCGRVTMGSECFLGAGVMIANDLTIADGTTMGIGAAITRSITEPGQFVVGNPMRIVPSFKI